ncbi:dihydrofolate reductase family protein [Streptosporangium sp. NPDC023825]|uniref:dihydrofolate reductase family protein n=1 Tax=Streptosporangium sp. NPDC023825 TaxID=3154909 RepID=UPI00343D8557
MSRTRRRLRLPGDSAPRGSRTVEKAGWKTRVISENVVEELTALKESGVTLLLFGGSVLASHLTEHGVIDEYRVFVHPVILGGGKPLFQEQDHRVGLELVESRTFDSRVVLLRHRRADARG